MLTEKILFQNSSLAFYYHPRPAPPQFGKRPHFFRFFFFATFPNLKMIHMYNHLGVPCTKNIFLLQLICSPHLVVVSGYNWCQSSCLSGYNHNWRPYWAANPLIGWRYCFLSGFLHFQRKPRSLKLRYTETEIAHTEIYCNWCQLET